MITFSPNLEKIRHVILYCIQHNDGGINKYNLNKILFAADKYHLNKYGRPVTGDVYVAMEYGTVPSKAMDMLSDFKTVDHFIFSADKPNMDLLSESDIEAIHDGFKEYQGLTFNEVKDKNHKDKAWAETPRNHYIPFELMIENEKIRQYLEENGSDISL